MLLVIIGILLMAVILYGVSVYNFFVTTKVRIDAAYQEIGNQLKRQANLIPNLVEAAKGYIKHEKEIFDALAQARQTVLSAAKDTSKLNQATEAINKIIPQFTAIMESNPEIKASEVINKLMNELRDTADKLVYARRTLIDLTADYNTKLVVFPSNMLASVFNFKPQPGLVTPTSGDHVTVSEQETKDINVKL